MIKIAAIISMFLSAVVGKEINNYDTTITLMSARPDSFFIYPINQYLHFDAGTTASCPSYTSADFVFFVRSDKNKNVERIPAQTKPLIFITSHCYGSEETGIKAGTVFSIEDRYYRIKLENTDVYFRVASLTDDFKAKIEFSSLPFTSSLLKRSSRRIKSDFKTVLEKKGRSYMLDGKTISRNGQSIKK